MASDDSNGSRRTKNGDLSVAAWTRLSVELAERLQAQASRELISQAAVIRRAVARHLDEVGA